MAIKTHKVTLSLDNPRVIQSGINVQSFDKQSIQISIELTKNDEVFQVPSDATIRVSLLKLARQEQKIIVDVPNTNRESIDWIVPDYLDGYQGTVRVGVYLVSGAENVDLGYFTILSNVSDIDKMAEEFTDSVMQGWGQIEADLAEIRATITHVNTLASDFEVDVTNKYNAFDTSVTQATQEITDQVDTTIANINAKNTQVNTLASDFEADVATKQTDVTNKYNAFDASVTQAGQTVDDILGLTDDVQQVSVQVAEKVQNFKLKNEVVNGDFSDGLINYSRKQNSSPGSIESLDIIDFKTSPQSAKWTQNNNNQYWVYDIPANINDKMYVSVDIKRNTTVGLFRGWTYNYQTITGLTALFEVDNNNLWTRYTVIKTLSENGLSFGLGNGTATTGSINIDNLLIINLTETFGTGNEPTKEEMDRLIERVPNQWWDGELDLTQQQYVSWLLSLIREKANKTQEEWIIPTLLNGWEHHTSGTRPSFFKDEFGIVHIRGFVKNKDNTALPQIFGLPIGYRPSSTIRLSIRNTASTILGLDITVGGFIIVLGSNKAEVSLDGVSFKVGG